MMKSRSITLLLAALSIGVHHGAMAQELASPEPRSRDVHGLRPQFPTDALLVKADKAIQNGLNFLVRTQNKDGSWGSHDPKVANLADFGFQLRHRGSQDAVRTACTAICAEALLNQADRTPEQQAALDLAIVDLTQTRKFAFHPGESFNTWGYGYKLGFLIRLAREPEGKKLEDEIRSAGQACVDGLLRFHQHNGGWSYYAGAMGDAGSMSFNTAFFGLTLAKAKEIGLEVPQGMVVDARRTVERQRAPNGSISYDSRFENSGPHILETLGSGARTISSTLALYHIGRYSQRDLVRAMQVFDVSENYLESGRKRIIPHRDAAHNISGYFFFFGYNYATEAAEILGEVVPQQRWDRFGWTMLRSQEANGSWWDTPAADYGDKWGTGFAVQTLQRFVRETRRRQADGDEVTDEEERE